MREVVIYDAVDPTAKEVLARWVEKPEGWIDTKDAKDGPLETDELIDEIVAVLM